MTGDSKQSATNVWPKVPIGELLTRVSRPVDVDESEMYRQIGIRSHCKGIFHKPPVTGKALGNKRVFWVEPGCLVFNIIFAWEQAVAVTTSAEQGMIASHRFPMYLGNGKLLPEYAHLYFSSPRGKYDLNIASPGGAGRNKTLGQEEFKRLKIPVPPIKHQQLTIDVAATWDRAIEGVQKLIRAKRRLKQGLAQQLLSGDRRLPQFESEWPRVKIKGICYVSYGKSPNGIANEAGRNPIFATGGVVGRTDHSLHDGPAVILGRKGSIDRPWMASGPFWATDTTFFAVPADDVSAAWLHQLFLSIRWRRYNEASGVPSLSRETINGIYILKPPMEEQRAIAEILDAVDQECSLLTQKLALIVEQKKGLMQKLFAGHVPNMV